MTVAMYSFGWQCECGHEQTESQRVTPAGPLDLEPDRVTCSACGGSSVLEFDYDTYYGASIQAVPVVAS